MFALIVGANKVLVAIMRQEDVFLMKQLIFVSHNSKDKIVVEPIAIKLSEVFGQENVFYDSWSIQPGDGIIDKMNLGLEEMAYFLFFISRNSLSSEMVKLEWQNALLKAAKGKCKFIPIKLDDCFAPAIILQNLYIDFYNYGFDVGVSQLISVLRGESTFIPNQREFKNVLGKVIIVSNNHFDIEIIATHFQEPIARFLILFGNKTSDVKVKVNSDGFFNGGPQNDIRLNDGTICNGFFIGLSRSLAPSFPLRVSIETNKNESLRFFGVMRAISEERFESVVLYKTL